jgi:predicted molibdopterin-dependent oxidoreductase YjgC
VEPPGQARADWEILLELAQRCGAAWDLASPAAIYEEMTRDTPKFAGISHERIDREGGMQWPCPTPDHPGTVFLHEGGVLRGKGLFEPVHYRPPVEPADVDYPLVLSTGRTLYHYNAATQTRRSPGLAVKQPEAFVELHPFDARARGIVDGVRVRVRTRRGAVVCRAMLSREVRPGCIWMPFHFSEARANLLTVDVGDSVTGTAEFKVCAAEVALEPGDAPEVRYPGAYAHEEEGEAAE